MAATNARNAASSTTTDTLRRIAVGRRPRRTLVRAALLAAAAFLTFGYLLIPVRGEGPSMEPTLADGQLVFVNTLAYWGREPARGDIVALRYAGRRVLYVKRVVALPGEQVRIDRGLVYVNGRPLAEPYVARRMPWQVDEIRLGRDEYLVIGDNRGMRQRQHDFGKAHRDRILGRVVSW